MSIAGLRLARQGLWSVLDHGMISLASLVVSLTMARFLPLDSYGFFVLVVVALNLFGDVFGALILGPLLIMGATRTDAALPSYLAAMLRLQVVGATAAATLFLLAGAMYLIASTAGGAGALAAAAFAASTMPLLQFVRRVFYVVQRPAQALACSAIYAISQFAALLGLLVLHDAGFELVSSSVFLTQGMAALIAIGYALDRGRGYLAAVPLRAAEVLRETWTYGRWLLLGVLVTVGYNQAIYALIAFYAGTEGVALFEGPRLLVAPCLLLLQAWGTMIGPQASRAFARDGVDGALRELWRGAPLAIIPIVGFIVILLLGPESLLVWVLGESFRGETAILLLWAGVVLATLSSTIISGPFYVCQKPSLGTWCRVITAAAGLPIAFLLVSNEGAYGGAWARLIVEVILASVTAYFVWRLVGKLRRKRSRPNN